ncbi:MAG: hypothetical protein JO053_01480 [Acidobacteria bacterium]|nr:hypothetical protein [Acidobacteriota bacterium]
MPKISEKTVLVRETTAPWESNDSKGKTVIEDIPVRYFCRTTKELKKIREDAMAKAKAAGEDPDSVEFPWLSTLLVNQIESLPTVTDEDDKPIAITVENLDRIPAINLQAIYKAIEDDNVPKPRPSRSTNG